MLFRSHSVRRGCDQASTSFTLHLPCEHSTRFARPRDYATTRLDEHVRAAFVLLSDPEHRRRTKDCGRCTFQESRCHPSPSRACCARIRLSFFPLPRITRRTPEPFCHELHEFDEEKPQTFLPRITRIFTNFYFFFFRVNSWNSWLDFTKFFCNELHELALIFYFRVNS